MPTPTPHPIGTPTLCRVTGRWEPATIRGVLLDGTYKVEHEHPWSRLMPYWYGVLEAELSVDDAAAWPAAWDAICAGASLLDWTRLHAAFARIEVICTEDQMKDFWTGSCEALFGADGDAAIRMRLERGQGYALLRRAGFCARSFEGLVRPVPPRPYQPLYWNQLRMGGRDPGELPRAVTLQDTLIALGLADAAEDPAAQDALTALEAQAGAAIPAELRTLLSRQGWADAVLHSHPNNPYPPRLGPIVSVRRSDVDGAFTLEIQHPHQGDHVWVAAWRPGDRDARVYLRREDDDGAERWALTAPSAAFFFWDQAQTGLAWGMDPGPR